MDRTRLTIVGTSLLVAAGGCGGMSSHRAPGPPPMLSKIMGPARAADPASDHYAELVNLNQRAPGAQVAASKPEAASRRTTATIIHSTAPPPSALLPAEPIAIALNDSTSRPRPEPDWVEPLPPLDNTRAPADAPRVTAPPAATDPLAPVRSIVAESRKRIEALSSYQVRMTRQERVGSTLQPEESVILSVRREPKAVRLEWPEGPSKGREVIYLADKGGPGMMHIHMPNNPLMPRMSLPPDSPLALRNSRHPITEAGFEDVVARVEESLRGVGTNTAGKDQLRHEGVSPAPGGGPACHRIVRVTPTGDTWVVLIDDATKLPYLVECKSSAGELLERYRFEAPKQDLTELAASGAFDPDSRWGPARGLLSRFARTAGPTEGSPEGPVTR